MQNQHFLCHGRNLAKNTQCTNIWKGVIRPFFQQESLYCKSRAVLELLGVCRLFHLTAEKNGELFYSERFLLFQRCRILDRVFGLERVILGFNAQIQLLEDSGRLMEGRPVTNVGHQGGEEFSAGVTNFLNYVQ